MLDLKPTTDDKQRLKYGVLPGENAVLMEYFKKNSYQQPPIVNAMYNSEEQMQQIMQAPQLTPDAKAKLYDQTLQRFLTFQSQLKNQHLVQNNLETTPNLAETPQELNSTVHLPSDLPIVPATPKTYF